MLKPIYFLILLLLICSACTPLKLTEGDIIEVNNSISQRENVQKDSTSQIETVEIIKELELESKQLIYAPIPKTSWQWQLSGEINTNYDVEMFDIDLINTPQSIIDKLHDKGIKVICYFSAGSWESFRSDADQFPKEVLGKTLKGWDNEKWLDVSNYNTFSKIMQTRLDLAVEKTCDGVEPDNVDAYQNKNGFDLTYSDQLKYNKWLAEEAHKRNLAIALKNDLDQVKDLVDYFDFAINEQCFEYDECDKLKPFIQQNKAVFGVEYELETSKFCSVANDLSFSWLKMDYDLDGGRISCND